MNMQLTVSAVGYESHSVVAGAADLPVHVVMELNSSESHKEQGAGQYSEACWLIS